MLASKLHRHLVKTLAVQNSSRNVLNERQFWSKLSSPVFVFFSSTKKIPNENALTLECSAHQISSCVNFSSFSANVVANRSLHTQAKYILPQKKQTEPENVSICENSGQTPRTLSTTLKHVKVVGATPTLVRNDRVHGINAFQSRRNIATGMVRFYSLLKFSV
jgi:hypothetical protein